LETQTQKTERPSRKDWLREYETIYLLPSETTDEASDKIAERFRELVGQAGGRVIKFTTWGRRKTAFEVRRQPRSLFVHMAYLGSGKTVSEVERNLRNLEEVEKFITTLVKPLVDPAARPTEQDVKMSGDIDERPARPERPEGVEGDIPDELVPDLNNVRGE
jgi:small subunit ribosomal protein S6